MFNNNIIRKTKNFLYNTISLNFNLIIKIKSCNIRNRKFLTLLYR